MVLWWSSGFQGASRSVWGIQNFPRTIPQEIGSRSYLELTATERCWAIFPGCFLLLVQDTFPIIPRFIGQPQTLWLIIMSPVKPAILGGILHIPDFSDGPMYSNDTQHVHIGKWSRRCKLLTKWDALPNGACESPKAQKSWMFEWGGSSLLLWHFQCQ